MAQVPAGLFAALLTSTAAMGIFGGVGVAEAGRLSALFSEYDDGSGATQISVLDPASGKIDMANIRTLRFPPTECKGGWILNGTNGQTSTLFRANRTFFFAAQLSCNGALGNTTLFSTFSGIYADLATGGWVTASTDRTDDPDSAVPIAGFPEMDGHSILELNIDWDHTCNVLVVAPNAPDPTTKSNRGLNATLVSEYDGEQRTLPGFGLTPQCGYPKPTGGCWHRVTGLSAVDWHASQYSRASSQETGSRRSAQAGAPLDFWHCEGCSFYFLEEQVDGYEEQPVVGAPRQLIGRDVMSGNLTLNITDASQLLSLEYAGGGDYSPDTTGAFIGVGVCCELGWCPPECEGRGGHATLVGWVPGQQYPRGPQVLAIVPAMADPQTAKLGIAVDVNGYPVDPPSGDARAMRASLIAGGQIFTYNFTADSSGSILAELIETSPSITRSLGAWWYSGS